MFSVREVFANFEVALRKESVDRNRIALAFYNKLGVALRKESVDRNTFFAVQCIAVHWSLSARRAWIEIDTSSTYAMFWRVALRKESVDRNCKEIGKEPDAPESLSARRAWIEILTIKQVSANTCSRSPQGERG